MNLQLLRIVTYDFIMKLVKYPLRVRLDFYSYIKSYIKKGFFNEINFEGYVLQYYLNCYEDDSRIAMAYYNFIKKLDII